MDYIMKDYPDNWGEMTTWFARRTHRHIDLARKYLNLIINLNLQEVDNKLLKQEIALHDMSKWLDPEYEPYVFTTWRYHEKDLGRNYELTEERKQQSFEATFHHVKNNKHHPEYWDANVTLKHLNFENRDKPSGELVDATGMPLTYIASMMADWLAMSEEKKTNVQDWMDMNIGIRWEFLPKQIKLMETIVAKVKKS